MSKLISSSLEIKIQKPAQIERFASLELIQAAHKGNLRKRTTTRTQADTRQYTARLPFYTYMYIFFTILKRGENSASLKIKALFGRLLLGCLEWT